MLPSRRNAGQLEGRSSSGPAAGAALFAGGEMEAEGAGCNQVLIRVSGGLFLGHTVEFH